MLYSPNNQPTIKATELEPRNHMLFSIIFKTRFGRETYSSADDAVDLLVSLADLAEQKCNHDCSSQIWQYLNVLNIFSYNQKHSWDMISKFSFVQLAGAVEYTDCTSAEG